MSVQLPWLYEGNLQVSRLLGRGTVLLDYRNEAGDREVLGLEDVLAPGTHRVRIAISSLDPPGKGNKPQPLCRCSKTSKLTPHTPLPCLRSSKTCGSSWGFPTVAICSALPNRPDLSADGDRVHPTKAPGATSEHRPDAGARPGRRWRTRSFRSEQMLAVLGPCFGDCATVGLCCHRKTSTVAVSVPALRGQGMASSSALIGSGTCRPTGAG